MQNLLLRQLQPPDVVQLYALDHHNTRSVGGQNVFFPFVDDDLIQLTWKKCITSSPDPTDGPLGSLSLQGYAISSACGLASSMVLSVTRQVRTQTHNFSIMTN